MAWVVPFALAGMALCAVLAITTPIVDTTYLTSWFTSTSTLAFGLSREFCRRTIMSINMDQTLRARARAFAAEQLHIFHREAKILLIPYISVCRHVVTDVVEKYPLLRLAEEYLTSSTGLPADFSPHTGTLFLLLATNVCTAFICLSIGATILAPLRIVWRSTKPRANPWAKPKTTWETVLEALAPALANLAAAGINGLVFCATGLIFCVGNIVMYIANLDFGLLMKRSTPQDEPRRVFYKTLPDPRVPELEENARKLENELQEKEKSFEDYHKQAAAEIHDLYGKNEVLEKANMAQKIELRGHIKMHGSIDLTRPMYEQLMEKNQRCNDLKGDLNRAVEEKIEMQGDFWKQLSDKCEDIKALKFSARAHKEERAVLLRSQEYHQERARRGDEISRVQTEFHKGRIQELERLMASQKESLEARIKELCELIASHEATIQSLEAQLKERDEANSTQKEAKQALEARVKEEDARHSSEQKSQKARLMKGFERERKKLADLSRLSSEARKAAEEKYKAADEARKVADEARETAEQARKTDEEARKRAEQDSAANLEARKAAEDAYKAAEEKLEAAEKALKAAEDARKAAEEESAANLKAVQAAEESLKVSEEARKAAEEESASLREQLDNRPPSQGKGTQASSPPPSPQKTPPGSPAKAPARPLGKSSCPPEGQRPFLPAISVRNRVDAKKQFNFSAPSTPNIPGTNPAAPSLGPMNLPAMPTALAPIGPGPTAPPTTPSAPAPSTPEPSPSPAAPSTPKPTTPPAAPSPPEPTNHPAAPEPTTPEAATSNPEPTSPSATPSAPAPSSPEPETPVAAPSPEPTTPVAAPSPEPTTPPAAPSTAEPASAEGSPGKSSGDSAESKQLESVNSTPAEASPVKPASPSGEAPEVPEPASA